jgi:NAD(P)-dependent dehydrogenase (short-subunit alcohol dehydrogenase family)
VTGVSPSGIGGATAAAFASQSPANLLLLSRTKSKLEGVADELRAKYPGVNIKTIPLDLGSQESIRAAAGEVAETISKLDILVNNAGLVVHTRQWMAANEWSPERIEMQFGANHIGPFLLTNLLLPLLLEAAKTAPPGETRVVSLASAGHRLSPIRFHDWNFEVEEVPPEETYLPGLSGAFMKKIDGTYLPIIAYSHSKTANILFIKELQKYLPQKGIAAYALHPGGEYFWVFLDPLRSLIHSIGVSSELGRDHDDEVAAAIEKTSAFWKNPDQGSSTTMVAALDPALDSKIELM